MFFVFYSLLNNFILYNLHNLLAKFEKPVRIGGFSNTNQYSKNLLTKIFESTTQFKFIFCRIKLIQFL